MSDLVARLEDCAREARDTFGMGTFAVMFSKAAAALRQKEEQIAKLRGDDVIGTHWLDCWKEGGPRHWQCAVRRAEAAERELAERPQCTCPKFWHNRNCPLAKDNAG